MRAVDRLKDFSEKLTPHGEVPAVREFRERLSELPTVAA